MDNPVSIPSSWIETALGFVLAALGWIVKGYATDVRKIKATYMTRQEINDALAAQALATTASIAAHQVATNAAFAELRQLGADRQSETSANLREIRARLDQLNDTLLKVATR